jgi:hypothetical protein
MHEKMSEVHKNAERINPKDLILMDAITSYGSQKIIYRIVDAMKFTEGDIYISLQVDGGKSIISIHEHEIVKDGEGYVINHDGRTYLVRPPKLD